MIEKLSLKQKIIIGILLAVLVIVVGIYGFITINNEEIENIIDLEMEELVETNQNEQETIKAEIVVHITGEVKKTGIVILPEGARIADAIEKAGGITEEADIDEINLAYVLEDGQKIYIPNKKDKELNSEKMYITTESGNNVIVQTKTGKGEKKKVNINEATQSELENLPGIGPSIASRIIEYREENGKFNEIEELQNVKGIGDAKFANIKEYIEAK